MESSSSSDAPFEANSRILLKLSQDPEKIHDTKSDPSSKANSRIILKLSRDPEKIHDTKSDPSSKAKSRIRLKLSQDPEKIHDIRSDPSSKVEYKKLQPEWLERFYLRKFFAPCSEHASRHNELNKYCIDCDTSFCQYCLSLTPHKEEHRLLKLYRHVYKDVVPLHQIEPHLDCSLIQPYRCNKQMVIALTPLPHLGSNKFNEEELCHSCKRKLMDSELYWYCSISCKVDAFTKRENTDVPPFLSLDLSVQNPKQGSELKNSSADQLVQNATQETEPKLATVDETLQEAGDVPEPKMTTVDQTAEKAEQPEPKIMTVDQTAQEAEQEPEPMMMVHETKQEKEPKMTTVDLTVEEAKQDPEQQVANADQLKQKEDPEPVINFRKRKRKGIPYRAPLF